MLGSRKSTKRKLWVECEGLTELAEWIDSIPAEFRVPILSAAISFQADDDFSSSYFVGICRSRLFDCVYSFCGIAIGPKVVGHFPPFGLESRISMFTKMKSPAETLGSLCDLLEFIAANFSEQSR